METEQARSLADALRLLVAEHDKQKPHGPDTPGIARARAALKNFEAHVHPWTIALTSRELEVLRLTLDRVSLEGEGDIPATYRRLRQLGLLTFQRIPRTFKWRFQLTEYGRTIAERE